MGEHITPIENSMAYVSGFKYQLVETIQFLIPKLAEYSGTKTSWIEIKADGLLVLKKGFASDGASGPTFDTPSSMRGAFVHDALYELMRKGLIPRSFRSEADVIIEELCVIDKMFAYRAKLWHKLLYWFGGKNVLASQRRQIRYAP